MQTGATIEGRFSFDVDALAPTAPSPAGTVERDVKVFRTGTFTDMRGRTRTYTTDDLDRAVENFRTLVDKNIVPNVPVRVDHTFSMKDVAGYIIGVRREGEFLLADLDFTDADVHAKYQRKHFRNRSLEIGQYVTNDGAKYDPVVLGLAFVDLPAVEGLYHLSTGEVMGTQNIDPSTQPNAAAAAAAAGATAAAEPVAQEPAQEPAAEPAAQEPAAEPAAQEPAAEPAAQEPAAEPAEPVGAHGAPGRVVHLFRVNGANVSDPEAVQNHIDSLELFRSETMEGVRVGFVDALAEQRIITGPQAEQFRKIVVEMTPEMFATFRQGFGGDSVAPANIFGRHPVGGEEGGRAPGSASAVADRISILEDVVHNHRILGKSDDEIAQLSSFKELQTLRQQMGS